MNNNKKRGGIYVIQKPDNIVNITTNSSSEIFVIGKDQDIKQVEKIVDTIGARNWMGKIKQVTQENLDEFINNNYHVFEYLFPGFPQAPSEWNDRKFSPEMKKLEGFYINAIRDLHTAYDLYGKDSLEYKEFQENVGKARDNMEKQFEKELAQWKAAIPMEQILGIHYYDCGEDNELDYDFYQLIHNSVPGRYARLS